MYNVVTCIWKKRPPPHNLKVTKFFKITKNWMTKYVYHSGISKNIVKKGSIWGTLYQILWGADVFLHIMQVTTLDPLETKKLLWKLSQNLNRLYNYKKLLPLSNKMDRSL